ncbi:hypothetical protein KSK37_06325 [Kaistella sp. DKR-2]|uniref:EbsA family protein n=1 Tax=Kaistella soli TaxID=2849654 RepID=UPI001185482B|nr:hypothetical protein [Kaistella soli]MBU8882694.1 hypothetical protein [Kaistella soli]
MKFSYANKRLYLNLVLGILWTIIGSSYFFEKENMKWNHYLFIVLGLLYLMMFAYEYLNKYFEITNEKIKLFSIPQKEIKISDIEEVKYYADEYTFKTENKSLKIVKSQVNKTQLSELENFFTNLQTELKKNAV